MSRRAEEHAEGVNPDSFLDIVASVVSIMIIMVVMEGSRIKNAPVQTAIPGDLLSGELEKDLTRGALARGRHSQFVRTDRTSKSRSGRAMHAARRAGHRGIGAGTKNRN